MLLQQWSEVSGILPTHPTTEKRAVSVVVDHDNTHRKYLYQLSDYVVSTCAGAVLWLVPAIRLVPGYAYVSHVPYPDGEDTETEMVTQSECDSAKSHGSHQIDGLTYRSFRSADGALYYFQLPC